MLNGKPNNNAENFDKFDDDEYLSAKLKNSVETELDIDLKNDILSAIDKDKYLGRKGLRGFASLFDFGRAGKYGASFAFGIVAGLTIYFVLSGNMQQNIDTRNLSGTAADVSSASEKNVIIFDKLFNYNDIKANVKVSESSDALNLSLSCYSSDEATVLLKFADNDISIENIGLTKWSVYNKLIIEPQIVKFITRGDCLVDLNIITARKAIPVELVFIRIGQTIYSEKFDFVCP